MFSSCIGNLQFGKFERVFGQHFSVWNKRYLPCTVAELHVEECQMRDLEVSQKCNFHAATKICRQNKKVISQN